MFNRVATLILAALFLSLLQGGGILSTLSNKTQDELFLLRGAEEPSQDIIIIGIDDASLAKLGSWPFSRKYHAQLLTVLNQARVIGFDLLFSEPTPQDAEFSKAIEQAPPVVFAAVRNARQKILGPGPSIEGGFGAGHIEILLGHDGVVRKTILKERAGSTWLPSFALVMAQAAGHADSEIPAQRPILINYYGPDHSFLYLSYIDVLNGTVPADFFKNRFVLIGAEALGIGDTHVTPFTLHDQTPGVEIQATILNNLLDQSWLRPLPMLSWGALALVIAFCLFLWPASTERINLLCNLSLAIGLFVLARILFSYNLYFNPVPCLVFLFLSYITHLVVERIWTAHNIYSQMRKLDSQLAHTLNQVYTNIPSRIFQHEPNQATRGVRQHLAHLQAGIRALALQHHFIENILSRELPPLILWERHTGNVILANAMFQQFWRDCAPYEAHLPNMQAFCTLLQEWQIGANTQSLTISQDDPEKFAACSLDIGLLLQKKETFYRVNLHPVNPQKNDIDPIDFEGILALLTDVTEIKKLERLKDEIVSIVSHELKLPLTVIQGYGEMLTGALTGEEKLYAEKICEQSQRLNKLIEDFLDVTRLEHGRTELRKIPLDLLEIMQEAVNLVSEPAVRKNIRLSTDLPHKVTPILADATLLLQSLTNLLDNAIKFSPDHSEIRVSLTEEPEQMRIAIADQGPGIAEDQQEAIFEKFKRGKQVAGQEGFGLGLNFVHQVVRKHGGHIQVRSAPEKGAMFILTLPKQVEQK